MIYTVRGPIHKSELGVTLGHEHIKWESGHKVLLSQDYDFYSKAKKLSRIIPVRSSLMNLSLLLNKWHR